MPQAPDVLLRPRRRRVLPRVRRSVVELYCAEDAEINYSTVQNWYSKGRETKSGLNLSTVRGLCSGARSNMSWTQVEAGAGEHHGDGEAHRGDSGSLRAATSPGFFSSGNNVGAASPTTSPATPANREALRLNGEQGSATATTRPAGAIPATSPGSFSRGTGFAVKNLQKKRELGRTPERATLGR
ncbi:hypothetical protein H6P81_006806 [Aristolochia fimbriata]|uniref:Uncharacterized protein n=1 Tax=Aristolochia fimbriata TaxID=158543 RepID=A0AAV7F276_ARIFI|nr:hypothetical protein H6P81_006806 [Aristolochia fimbriata]